MAHYVIQPRLDELRIGRGEPSDSGQEKIKILSYYCAESNSRTYDTFPTFSLDKFFQPPPFE
jgi:hypothetical protein